MNKNSLFLCTALLQITALQYAADSTEPTNVNSLKIVLPSESSIKARLCELGLDHFVKTTNIGNRLGGSKTTPLVVAHQVTSMIDNYNGRDHSPRTEEKMERLRPAIIKALVQDFPEAVVALEEFGTFKNQMTITQANNNLGYRRKLRIKSSL